MGRRAIPIEPYIEKLVQAIALGATYEIAAMFAGISGKTFERWRQRAEEAPEGSPLAQLRQRLLEAEGRAAVGWLAKIETAANNGDWRAAAFKLERKYPEIYGRTFQKVALTDASGEREGALVLKVVYADAIDAPPEPLRLAAPPDESLG